MAHTLKIAGASYEDVAKVTFTDTGGTSRAYLDADEVYTKDQATQLIKNDRNRNKELLISTIDTDSTLWTGDESDITMDDSEPADTYMLWIEPI